MPDYFDAGFAVREASWHRKETLLADWPDNWDEAWRLANNDNPWDIAIEPAYRLHAKTATFAKTDSNFLVRDDTGLVLSTRGPEYMPITNAEYGAVIEQVMEAHNLDLKYETTVILRGGRMIATTMFLPQDILIKGDPSPMRLYLVFMTSHDGSCAFKFGKSHVRIVCWNTQQAAENELDRSRSGFMVKHTLNWKKRLDDVLDGIRALRVESNTFLKWADEMVAKDMTATKVDEFMDKWLPHSTDMTAKQLAHVMDRRARFMQLLNASVTTDGIRGTQWGVYQAAVETCDHFTKSRSLDSEIKRQLLTGDDRKASAKRILAAL
jgi:phage/plasmid-like protein (TIGR03299 family)